MSTGQSKARQLWRTTKQFATKVALKDVSLLLK